MISGIMGRSKKSLLLSFLWCLGVLVCCVGAQSSNVMKIVQTGNKQQRARSILKYNNVETKAESNGTEEAFLAYDLQIVAAAVQKLNFSKCARDAMVVLDAITRREKWAVQIFDSSSKFPVGLLFGNFYQLGNFDECINSHQPFTDAHDSIRGQYCLATVQLKQHSGGRAARSFQTVKEKPRHIFNSTMHWSICVPNSCTLEEVKIVIGELFTLATEKEVLVDLVEEKCHIDSKKPFTTLEIVYGCLVGIFLVFVALATGFHFYTIQMKDTSVSEPSNTLKEALFCFSVIKTTGKFLSTKTSSLNLECLCGIKFLSMLLIIAGHTCLFIVGGPVQNTNFYDEESRNFVNAIFVNSVLLVDTFLLVSGFLMCYLLLLELDKRKGKLNILILYVARYIRLTPSYLVVLGFYCTFLFRLGDGPLWDSRIKMEQERCLKSWWTNLLYVNNYVNTDNLCMFQSWYLATDYHLFILAPFFVYPLWKWSKMGKNLLGIGILVSVITPFVITLKDQLDPTLMIFAPEVFDIAENFYFKEAYIKTHMRAGAYFLGLSLGFILYKLQTKGTKLPKIVLWLGWLISATCGIISMYSVCIFYDPNHKYNAFEAAAYASLHRVAWCISIGWIIIVCVTKNAGLVNRFLSWKPFMPLSRLTYCAYLINGFIEVYTFASVRSGAYMSKTEMGSTILAHSILTFSSAFLLCIFFESPIHGLEKILLRRDASKRREINRSEGNNTPV